MKALATDLNVGRASDSYRVLVWPAVGAIAGGSGAAAGGSGGSGAIAGGNCRWYMRSNGICMVRVMRYRMPPYATRLWRLWCIREGSDAGRQGKQRLQHRGGYCSKDVNEREAVLCAGITGHVPASEAGPAS